MFSKTKSQSPHNSAAQAAQTPQTPATASPRQAKAAGGVPSIISPDLTITGDLNSSGDIQVDGTVRGDVTADTLTIGEQGQVEGKVRGERVRVCGTVEGEIEGGTVTLAASARVLGDIVHDSLAIEPGAHLEGHCRRRGASSVEPGAGRETGRDTGQAKAGKPAQAAKPSDDAPTAGESGHGKSEQKSAPLRNGSAASAS
jgi:cytoskeletal protein CcmA (bactofilin family)